MGVDSSTLLGFSRAPQIAWEFGDGHGLKPDFDTSYLKVRDKSSCWTLELSDINVERQYFPDNWNGRRDPPAASLVTCKVQKMTATSNRNSTAQLILRRAGHPGKSEVLGRSSEWINRITWTLENKGRAWGDYCDLSPHTSRHTI